MDNFLIKIQENIFRHFRAHDWTHHSHHNVKWWVMWRKKTIFGGIYLEIHISHIWCQIVVIFVSLGLQSEGLNVHVKFQSIWRQKNFGKFLWDINGGVHEINFGEIFSNMTFVLITLIHWKWGVVHYLNHNGTLKVK
jgi:hypothetical protein